MERSEPTVSPGKRWACRAASGNCGRSKSAVCVDCICCPLGNLMLMPLGASLMSVTALASWLDIKCPVHAESAVAAYDGCGVE